MTTRDRSSAAKRSRATSRNGRDDEHRTRFTYARGLAARPTRAGRLREPAPPGSCRPRRETAAGARPPGIDRAAAGECSPARVRTQAGTREHRPQGAADGHHHLDSRTLLPEDDHAARRADRAGGADARGGRRHLRHRAEDVGEPARSSARGRFETVAGERRADGLSGARQRVPRAQRGRSQRGPRTHDPEPALQRAGALAGGRRRHARRSARRLGARR